VHPSNECYMGSQFLCFQWIILCIVTENNMKRHYFHYIPHTFMKKITLVKTSSATLDELRIDLSSFISFVTFFLLGGNSLPRLFVPMTFKNMWNRMFETYYLVLLISTLIVKIQRKTSHSSPFDPPSFPFETFPCTCYHKFFP